MGLLSNLARGLVRGADRTAEITSKRGPKSFYRSRGAKPTGYITSSGKFVKIKKMVPELVVPNLKGFSLKAYVSYKAPSGTEQPLTAKKLFMETAAVQIEKDFREGIFDSNRLEKYGFEPSQEDKVFRLFPKNYVR
ncbi:39S ribosomal protein L41, mitochondrial [Amblyraja radiata]|uniref:39S ribosomal protein L41, mitochondrial n=1 Tax=Amblyraja radiata TaxID=386614 RepID=UPI001403B86B|nr:39S ribosomal protein L41, mitochondrial [Amblyraja radiata]XP_032905206.1 39S ribosomal protein L41, mitochondrial [Amblyraja radiata]XP_032905207.1 39S ribosomal protein L41, mitochondrial [Amblyraja radiata]XP_032905209.1 39S ribosomal protein L41, mitochondrial [Amblyraja radiata]